MPSTARTIDIKIHFKVRPMDPHDEDDDGGVSEADLQEAAEVAALDFLVLCTESTQGTIVDEVEVYVDGFGRMGVSLDDPCAG